jgi:hypothetical protein
MSVRAWTRHVPIALLVVSVGVNVVLAKRLKALQPPPAAALQAGERVPELDVKTLSGTAVHFTFDEPLPTVLYYFSPTCGWCERNWDNVRAIAAAAPGRYRFVGLSSSANVEAFMRDRGLSFDVFTGVSADALRAYHLSGTPQTVVVAPGGTVIHAWSGAYTNRQQRSIADYFRVELPGLRPVQP